MRLSESKLRPARLVQLRSARLVLAPALLRPTQSIDSISQDSDSESVLLGAPVHGGPQGGPRGSLTDTQGEPRVSLTGTQPAG